MLTGSAQQLDDVVKGDVFRASVTAEGACGYSTFGGGTKVPHLQIDTIRWSATTGEYFHVRRVEHKRIPGLDTAPESLSSMLFSIPAETLRPASDVLKRSLRDGPRDPRRRSKRSPAEHAVQSHHEQNERHSAHECSA